MSTSEPAESQAPESEDETRRKFREALERKNAKSSAATDHKDRGTKQSKAHGAAENRREFRRKSI